MAEKSGGPVSYYLVQVDNPNQGVVPYQAECGDIIEALGMTFNEGCEFKALWRIAAARTLGKLKEGGDEKYDREKCLFYAKRSLSVMMGKKLETVIGIAKPAPVVADIKTSYVGEDVKKEFEQRITNVRRFIQALVDHGQVEPLHLSGLQHEIEKLSLMRHKL